MKIRYTRTYELDINDLVMRSISHEVHQLGFRGDDEIELIVKDYIDECGDSAEIIKDSLAEKLTKVVAKKYQKEAKNEI